MAEYKLEVTTGAMQYAGTSDYMYVTLFGTEEQSERTLHFLLSPGLIVVRHFLLSPCFPATLFLSGKVSLIYFPFQLKPSTALHHLFSPDGKM